MYLFPFDLLVPLLLYIFGGAICWLGVRFIHFPDLRFLAGLGFLFIGGVMVWHGVGLAIKFGLGS